MRLVRAAQAANQFFAFAGEHRSDDDLDPSHVALDYVHSECLLA